MLRDRLQFNCKISQSIFSFHNPNAFQVTLSSGQTETRLCWQCPNIPTFWSSGFFFFFLLLQCPPMWFCCTSFLSLLYSEVWMFLVDQFFGNFCVFLLFFSWPISGIFPALPFILAHLPLFPMYALKSESFSLPKEWLVTGQDSARFSPSSYWGLKIQV